MCLLYTPNDGVADKGDQQFMAHSYLYLIESCNESSNCNTSLIRKLKGIPERDSLPKGSSECFSEIAIPLDETPKHTQK